jgi:TolB-like protein/Tfp pilus assembly protein PilF
MRKDVGRNLEDLKMKSPYPVQTAVHFGVFEVDLRARELRKQGVKLKLQEQPLEVLKALLEKPGEIVTREELQQKIWPSDTFVDFDHGLYNAIKRLREALGDSAETPQYVETLARRGYRFIGKIDCEGPRVRSLAVLPLENLSRDPEQEYFAEGLTEALITTLAKIGELRVVSRTSAMQYKGVHKPLREIARELEVDAIVEGTVLRAGDRVRITTQLIDAAKEAHLWAESYERDLRDVLTLQAEVAQAIAREVRVKLTPQEQANIAQVRLVDPEAYEAYLKGRYHWNRRPGIRKSMEYFEQAVAKDPTYAAAYAGLADCLSALSAWGFLPANEGCVKAKMLAQKALRLDSSLGEAHTSLAFAAMYDFDFLTAQREFERSIELSPRYATAHHLFGFYLGVMGRYEEAYTELQRAIRLDPLLSLTNGFLGYIYLYARRYDQAIEQFVKTLELDPNSSFVYGGLGWAYRCNSLHEPAIAALRKAVELWHGPSPLSWLGEAYAAAGRRDEALKVLEQLHELAKERYVTPYGVARIYAALDMKEEALHWLETAYRQRAEWMVLLKVDPCFDDLRPDPRLQDVLRQMNFPP